LASGTESAYAASVTDKLLTLYTVDDVARRLHKSRRWLFDFLRQYPCGKMAGRTHLFIEDDVRRLIQLAGDHIKRYPARNSDDGAYSLYRHFDASGRLLYVGISLYSLVRTIQHRSKSSWFDEVTRIEIVRFASKSEAQQAEAEAIATENPLHNKARPKVAA
jgi:hypothetical protein